MTKQVKADTCTFCKGKGMVFAGPRRAGGVKVVCPDCRGSGKRAKSYAEKEIDFRNAIGVDRAFAVLRGDRKVDRPKPGPFEPPRDLPWQNSYSNWCAHLSVASAKHNARIAYGDDTYRAWRAGVAPSEYARERGTR